MLSPMKPALHWDRLRILLAVARAGSLVQASAGLGVNAATVARQLTALEAQLGTRLFHRSPTGLTPTEAGRATLLHAEQMEALATAALQQLAGRDARPEGWVRLTATEPLLVSMLVPALESLRLKHPGLHLELVATQRVLKLSRREADVSVRLIQPQEASLKARRVGTLQLALFAQRALAAARPLLPPYDDVPVIGYAAELAEAPEARWWARHAPRARIVCRASSIPVIQAAAAAGLGVALLPCFEAQSHPALVRVATPEGVPHRGIWLTVHQDMAKAARVRAVLDHLAEHFQRLAPRLQGGT